VLNVEECGSYGLSGLAEREWLATSELLQHQSTFSALPHHVITFTPRCSTVVDLTFSWVFLMLGCSNNNYAYSTIQEKCAEHRRRINDRRM
jgi:hypothetical protein